MRLGDYVLFGSITLNFIAMCGYAYQGHWKMTMYWFAVLQLNGWLITMK
jgi:hypothetical protein